MQYRKGKNINEHFEIENTKFNTHYCPKVINIFVCRREKEMANIVSYPNYCPDTRSLRSYLLVYDHLSTIVPHVDQYGVENRKAWAEIKESSKEDVLGFFDPSYKYTKWSGHPTSVNELERLAYKVCRSKSHRKLVKKMRIDAKGYLLNDHDRSKEYRLRAAGWSPLAIEKMSQDLLASLLDKKLAFKVEPEDFEQNPVLIEPILGRFILARLARQIASEENVSPVTSLKRQVDNLLLDDDTDMACFQNLGQTYRYQRTQLLAVSLDIAIPAEIDNLRVGDYWEIRESFGGVRLELNSMLDEFSKSLDLDSEHDLKHFVSLVNDKRSDIGERIKRADLNLHRDSRRNLAIDIVVGATTSGLGAIIGGVPGAMIGAGIAPVASKFGKSVSTPSKEKDINYLSQLAVMRNKVTRQARVEAYQRPMYYL